jgi:TrmH family RNA methyltransferase
VKRLSKQLARKISALGMKKKRRSEGLFVAEGFISVREALRAGRAGKVVVSDEFAAGGRMSEITAAAERAGAVIFAADGKLFAGLASTVSPQGVLALCESRFTGIDEIAASGKPVVVLDGVSDPGNAGAILRSAAAFGVGGAVFACGAADPANAKVVRGSMGAVFKMAIHVADDLTGDLITLKEAGYSILAASTRGGTDPSSFETPGKWALAVGNEARGASAPVDERADALLTIQLEEGVESLNAAAAAAVLFYALSGGRPRKGRPENI